MFVVIPLRILTALVGLMLGYTAGTYWEILYEKRQDYHQEVVALLTSMKYAIGDDEGEYSPGYDDDIDLLCVDCCASDTGTSESESE